MPDTSVIEALAAAFLDTHKELAKTIKEARNASLTDLINLLTRVERTPGLPVALFGLVAAAKQALLNPSNDEKVRAFWHRAQRDQGLV